MGGGAISHIIPPDVFRPGNPERRARLQDLIQQIGTRSAQRDALYNQVYLVMEKHEKEIRCQSCGMPLGEGAFGTNADGTPNNDYCKLCYANGAFAEPTLTMDQMIKKSVRHMMTALKFEEERAEVLANAVIPTLKRWRP